MAGVGALVELFDEGFEMRGASVGEVGVALLVFLNQGEMFFDETGAEFDGIAGLGYVEAFALAHKDLLEVGGVAQDGFRAVVGFATDGFDNFAFIDGPANPPNALR